MFSLDETAAFQQIFYPPCLIPFPLLALFIYYQDYDYMNNVDLLSSQTYTPLFLLPPHTRPLLPLLLSRPLGLKRLGIVEFS